jgi:hypothetical protein
MRKNVFPLTIALGVLFAISSVNPVSAIDLDENTRTVPLDSSGTTVILTP